MTDEFTGLESSEPLDLPADQKYCPHFNLHRSQGDWVCTNCGVRHPDSGWVVYFSTVAEAQAKALETLQNDLKAARKDQKRIEIIRAWVEKFPLTSGAVILRVADEHATAEMG